MSIKIEKVIKVELFKGLKQNMIIRYSSEDDPRSIEFILESNPSFRFKTDIKDFQKVIEKFGGQ